MRNTEGQQDHSKIYPTAWAMVQKNCLEPVLSLVRSENKEPLHYSVPQIEESTYVSAGFVQTQKRETTSLII